MGIDRQEFTAGQQKDKQEVSIGGQTNRRPVLAENGKTDRRSALAVRGQTDRRLSVVTMSAQTDRQTAELLPVSKQRADRDQH